MDGGFRDEDGGVFAEWDVISFCESDCCCFRKSKEEISKKYEGIRPDKIKVILNGINGSKYNNKIYKNKKKERAWH